MEAHNTIIGEQEVLSKAIHPALDTSLAQGWILLSLERGIAFFGVCEFIPQYRFGMRENGCLCLYPYCGEMTVKIQAVAQLLF